LACLAYLSSCWFSAFNATTQYSIDVKIEENVKLPGKLEAERRAAATHEYFKKALESYDKFGCQYARPLRYKVKSS